MPLASESADSTPRTIWVIWCARAKSTMSLAMLSPVISCHVAPTSPQHFRTLSSSFRADDPDELSSTTETISRSVFSRCAMRAARRTIPVIPGASVTATMIRSFVSHVLVGCRRAR